MWPLLIGWSKIAICVLYKAKASFFCPPLHCEKYLAKESAERKWIFQGVCVGGNGDLRPTSSGHDQIYRPFQCVQKLAFPICFYQYADFLSSPLKHHLGLGASDGLWRRGSDGIMACTICTTDSTPTYCLRDYCILKFFILKQWNGGNENHRHFTILGRIVFFFSSALNKGIHPTTST